jgi:hypothetical protein
MSSMEPGGPGPVGLLALARLPYYSPVPWPWPAFCCESVTAPASISPSICDGDVVSCSSGGECCRCGWALTNMPMMSHTVSPLP